MQNGFSRHKRIGWHTFRTLLKERRRCETVQGALTAGALVGQRSSRRLMSYSLGIALVAIDRTQFLIYAGRRSDGLLEGLLLIVISGLTHLARTICVDQDY